MSVILDGSKLRLTIVVLDCSNDARPNLRRYAVQRAFKGILPKTSMVEEDTENSKSVATWFQYMGNNQCHVSIKLILVVICLKNLV